jgi:hypothetical protein
MVAATRAQTLQMRLFSKRFFIILIIADDYEPVYTSDDLRLCWGTVH